MAPLPVAPVCGDAASGWTARGTSERPMERSPPSPRGMCCTRTTRPPTRWRRAAPAAERPAERSTGAVRRAGPATSSYWAWRQRCSLQPGRARGEAVTFAVFACLTGCRWKRLNYWSAAHRRDRDESRARGRTEGESSAPSCSSTSAVLTVTHLTRSPQTGTSCDTSDDSDGTWDRQL